MAGRAKQTNLNDKFLRALVEKNPPEKPELLYDKVLPDLILRWSDTGALTWGMKKRWPGGSSNTSWRSLGKLYVPPEDDSGDGEVEVCADGALKQREARDKARRWIELLERGIDPAVEARKCKIDAAKRITFELRARLT
jgi:Arm DNA-binding domain